MRIDGLDAVQFHKFNSGRSAKLSPLALPDDMAAEIINFRYDEQSMKVRPGAGRVNTSTLCSGPFRGIGRYYRATGSNKWWLAAGGTTVFKVTDTGTVSRYAISLTRGCRTIFDLFRGRAYGVNGVDGVFRILGNTSVFLSTELIPAPLTAPVIQNLGEVAWDAMGTTAKWSYFNIHTPSGHISALTIPAAYSGATFIRCRSESASSEDRWLGVKKQIQTAQNWNAFNRVSVMVRSTRSFTEGKLAVKQSGGSSWSDTLEDMSKGSIRSKDRWHKVEFDLSLLNPPTYRASVGSLALRMGSLDGTVAVDFDHILTDAVGSEDARWVTTFYSSSLAKESLASPASEVGVISPLSPYSLLALQRCSNTVLVNKVKLYRTVGGIMGDYYFATMISNPATSTNPTCVDRVSDVDLGAEYSSYSASGVGVPPAGASLIRQHKHRMIYAVDSSNPSRIWVSNLNDAETCPTLIQVDIDKDVLQGGVPENFKETVGGYIDIDRDNGQRVTCLSSTGDVLWIGKTHSCYLLSGDSMLNFQVQKLSDQAGAYGPLAAASCENEVVWVDWANSTVWAWSAGQGIRDIGQPISDLIKTITSANATSVSAAYQDRRFVFSYKNGSADEWCEYDFRTGTWTSQDGEIMRSGWSRHRGQPRSMLAVAAGPGDNANLFFADSSLARIWKQTGTCKDGGTAISSAYLFKSLDFNKPGGYHRLRGFETEIEGTVIGGAAPRLQVAFFLDKLGTAGRTGDKTVGVKCLPTMLGASSNGIRRGREGLPWSVEGYRIQPRLSITASVPVAIHRFGIYYSRIR